MNFSDVGFTPEADMLIVGINVCFSNRPLRVKRYQTVHCYGGRTSKTVKKAPVLTRTEA
jgi:hypothetical protein